MSNPIIPHDEPAGGTYMTPGKDGAPARRIFRFREMLTMPRGIEMKEYVHSDGSITFIGQYHNKLGNAASRPKRVYQIKLSNKPICLYSLPGEIKHWEANIFEDSMRLVSVGGGGSKWTVAFAALGALRGILHKRCVHTNSNRKAKRREKNKEGK